MWVNFKQIWKYDDLTKDAIARRYFYGLWYGYFHFALYKNIRNYYESSKLSTAKKLKILKNYKFSFA